MKQRISISSDSLYALKIFAMVCVVLIHSALNTSYQNFGSQLTYFISKRFCAIAVPCFYVISGMLFFKGIDGNIGRKLKSRFFTILIPYLCWNLIGAIAFLIKIKFFSSAFPQFTDCNLTPMNFIKGFWSLSAMGIQGNHFPYDFTLWFVRDLIVIIPFSVLIYKLIKTPLWFLPIIFLIFCLTKDINYFGLCSSFCYFYTGGVIQRQISIKSDNSGRIPMKKFSILSITGIIIYTVWCYVNDILPFTLAIYMRFIFEIVGVVSLIMFFNVIKINPNISKSIYSRSLFFIYAAHGLWSTLACKLVGRLFPSPGSFSVLIAFIVTFLILWYVDMLLYIILHKISPRLAGLFSGNRG